MKVVHQIEIQRKGGVCSVYPSSCIVRDLIARAGLFKPFETLSVLDLTFGQGLFYYSFRNKAKVFGFDVQRLDWVVKPYRFYKASCDKWGKMLPDGITFDLVVVDPPFSPYRRGWGKRHHYRDNCSISRCMYEAMKASEKFKTPILIHFFWKTIPYNYETIVETWFQGWSRLTKLPRPTWFGIVSKEVVSE